MSKYYLFVFFAIISTVSILTRCVEDENIPTSYDQTFTSDAVSLSKYRMPTDFDSIDFNAPIEVYDKKAAYLLGLFAFTCPSKNVVSCASCHDERKGGFPNESRPVGLNGRFDLYLKEFDQDVKIDFPPVNSPPFYNSAFVQTALTDGALGMGGMNATIDPILLEAFSEHNAKGWDGIYTQATVGLGAHDQTSIKEIMSEYDLFEYLSEQAFQDTISETTISVSIGMFERLYVTYDAPFQKYIRNELSANKLSSEFGMTTFLNKCVNCHNGTAFAGNQRARKIAESDFVGFFRVTKDSADLYQIAVPQLYNLRESAGMFHTDEKLTVRAATKKHIEAYDMQLSKRELTQLQRFINNDLYDREASKRVLDFVLDFDASELGKDSLFLGFR